MALAPFRDIRIDPAFLMTGAGVADVINLKRFKKRMERERSATQAETNRARSGRTKSERARDKKREQRADEFLDQHQLDDGGQP